MTRMRRSNLKRRGFTRSHAGRGFSYRDPAGRPVKNPELRERFDALAIPPAWSEVWIAPHPNGHIQATGRDAAGRRQYLYHPHWRLQQDRRKFERALALAETMPAARAFVTRCLRKDESSRLRSLSAAFRILDAASLRVGSERYAERYGSHGLATLLRSHVRLDGDRVLLRFPAKSRQMWDCAIEDADLAAFVRHQEQFPAGAPLLSWMEDESIHALSPADINDFIREHTGGDFTAKDFRTLHGTLAAAASLAEHGPARSRRDRTRAVAQAMKDAAGRLGNTPTIARKSYVDPRLIDRFDADETMSLRSSPESALRTLLGS